MRLTLRTMLAYLDDILDPADADQIAQKIKESEFASGLVHRIRGSMRKLRLGAPKLEGKGLGLDCNSVAEYLDNTLTSDRVPDFEKVCLESDIHLAEVASCHQILTLVLGEPAEIPIELRERMYEIPHQATRSQPPAAVATAAALEAEAPDTARMPAESARQQTPPSLPGSSSPPIEQPASDADGRGSAQQEIPDYLKAGKRNRAVPIVATALLLFLAVSIAVFAIGPQNIANWFQDSEAVDVADNSADEKATKSQAEVDKPAADKQSKAGKPAATDQNGTAKGKQDQVAKPAVVATEPPESDNSDAASARPENSDDASPTVVAKSDGVVPESIKPEANGETVKPLPESPAVDKTATDPTPADGTKKPAAEAKAEVVGRYMSEKQIFASRDPKTGTWQRVAANSPVRSGERFFVLPAYRPQLAFSTGVQLTLAGPAAGTLIHPDESGTPGLAVDYGWAMIMTLNKPNAQFHVDLAGARGTLTFLDAESAAAIEVQRYLAPGENPETVEAQAIVQVIAPHGKLHWQSDEGESITLNESGIIVLTNGKTTAGTLNVLPMWLETTAIDPIDEIASESLEPLIPLGRSLELSLEELVIHKNVELRMFAARSLTYLDYFEPFVTMLSDERNKSFWRKHLNAVKDALARGPESARAVRFAFEKTRGDKADELYRLTWGYSPSQLAAGEDARLVEFLRHPDLDFRVLAWENLWRITGKTGLYRPEGPERSRATRIRTWEEKLDEGEIVYRALPVPPTLIPLE